MAAASLVGADLAEFTLGTLRTRVHDNQDVGVQEVNLAEELGNGSNDTGAVFRDATGPDRGSPPMTLT